MYNRKWEQSLDLITWRIRTVETSSCCYWSGWMDGTGWWPLTCNQNPALGGWETWHCPQSQLGLKEHGGAIESGGHFIMSVRRWAKFFFPRVVRDLWWEIRVNKQGQEIYAQLTSTIMPLAPWSEIWSLSLSPVSSSLWWQYNWVIAWAPASYNTLSIYMS